MDFWVLVVELFCTLPEFKDTNIANIFDFYELYYVVVLNIARQNEGPILPANGISLVIHTTESSWATRRWITWIRFAYTLLILTYISVLTIWISNTSWFKE